jgi:FKBP12-rapamycin complex-associated protein
MEVTGIDGNFRLTCERVLRLLRSNNDSILAVLESFVYDPVLNWRFTEEGAAGKDIRARYETDPPKPIIT